MTSVERKSAAKEAHLDASMVMKGLDCRNFLAKCKHAAAEGGGEVGRSDSSVVEYVGDCKEVKCKNHLQLDHQTKK